MRGWLVAIAIGCTLWAGAGCSDSSTEPKSSNPARLDLVGGSGQSGTVGQVLPDSLVVKVLDEEGRGLSDIAVRWAVRSGGGSLSASIVRTDGAGLAAVAWTLGTAVGSAEVSASVPGLDPATFTATGMHDVPAEVILDPDSLIFNTVGDTARLEATVADRYGNLITSTPLEWSSTDTTVARVDSAGLVTAGKAGVATIVAATSSGSADSAAVHVVQEVAALAIVAESKQVEIGDTIRLAVEAYDAAGDPVAGLSVAWVSSAPDIATVDSSGLVLGRLPGRVEISATVRAAAAGAKSEVTEALEIEVVIPSGVYITGITPATLVPGGAATIVGGGFGAMPVDNAVTVQGLPATVVSVSDAALTVTVPSAEQFGCQPTQAVEVSVTVAERAVRRLHPLSAARQLPELEPGAYVNITDAAEVACNEIPLTGGSYLVSVYNTSSAASSSSPFRLVGAAGEVSSVANVLGDSTERWPAGDWQGAVRQEIPRLARIRDRLGVVARGTRVTGPIEPIWSLEESDARAEAHAALLERSREMATRLGPPRRGRRARGGVNGTASPGVVGPMLTIAGAPQPLTVGSVLDLRVPDIKAANYCHSFIPVRARVVYAGPKAIVLEDSVAPLAGTMDEHYRAVGREYEQTMHAIIEEYFGDPFAFDALTSGVGRVLMLFSPKVNNFGGVAGFVAPSDFYERSTCASSNEAPIFYGIVPTSVGSGYHTDTADWWLWSMPSTVIHEVKHVTSFAERFARNATVFEESWLEESTARISEELYARKIFGYTQLGTTNYRSSIYCEVRIAWPECGSKPLVMRKHFAALYNYMKSTNTLSPLGRTSESDVSFYGSGWLLVRWALDHFGESESAFLRALTQERNSAGVQNLVARTGRSFPELLGPWSLSLYWNRPTAPGLSHPSWDVYDIFAGLNADYPDSYTDSYPLYGWRTSFGSFTSDVNRLNGGTAALYFIDGTQSGPQLLELQGYGGGPLPPSLRMAIMRVK